MKKGANHPASNRPARASAGAVRGSSPVAGPGLRLLRKSAMCTALLAMVLSAGCFKADLENAGDPEDPDNLPGIFGILLGADRDACILGESRLDECNLQ